MKRKHQVKISGKRNRVKAGRKYRRQESQDLKGLAQGSGQFRQRRSK